MPNVQTARILCLLLIKSMARGGDRGGRKPRLSPEQKKVSVTYRLQPNLLKLLKAQSEMQNISQTELLEQILTKHFYA